ncbi:MAG TPA: hypothetical protein VGC00_04635 [Thermoanaerobaculia bacterium]|jgi:hypothetical protein
MVTLWLLALAAIGGLFYWMRRSMRSSAGKKRLESVRREAAVRSREQDRLDCLELETALRSRLASDDESVAARPAPPATR